MGYLDPGLFGMISQLGLAVLLAVVSGFVFFLKPIKKLFSTLFNGKSEAKQSDKAEDSGNTSDQV